MSKRKALKRKMRSMTTKHRMLEECVAQEQTRPLPDSITLTTLKRQKLALKDGILRLSGELQR